MSQLTQSLVRELLHYDPDTGVFTWKERSLSHFKTDGPGKIWNKRFSGKEAGKIYVNSLGYKSWILTIKYKTYQAHRIAFLYMTGDIPPAVDHINRNATDNRWCNLRRSDWSKNALNKSSDRRNKTGCAGVYWDKCRSMYQAYVNKNKVRYRLGRFEKFEDAKAAVEKKRKELGFSEDHGKKRPQ